MDMQVKNRIFMSFQTMEISRMRKIYYCISAVLVMITVLVKYKTLNLDIPSYLYFFIPIFSFICAPLDYWLRRFLDYRIFFRKLMKQEKFERLFIPALLLARIIGCALSLVICFVMPVLYKWVVTGTRLIVFDVVFIHSMYCQSGINKKTYKIRLLAYVAVQLAFYLLGILM